MNNFLTSRKPSLRSFHLLFYLFSPTHTKMWVCYFICYFTCFHPPTQNKPSASRADDFLEVGLRHESLSMMANSCGFLWLMQAWPFQVHQIRSPVWAYTRSVTCSVVITSIIIKYHWSRDDLVVNTLLWNQMLPSSYWHQTILSLRIIIWFALLHSIHF